MLVLLSIHKKHTGGGGCLSLQLHLLQKKKNTSILIEKFTKPLANQATPVPEPGIETSTYTKKALSLKEEKMVIDI